MKIFEEGHVYLGRLTGHTVNKYLRAVNLHVSKYL